jgi:beta-phosphoglucomutase family hydrolase
MVGMPDHIFAFLFDLDGVLTDTATAHAAAWKDMFDEYLHRRAERTGEPFVPFDKAGEYERYIDGKLRADGTRALLRSRGIELPEGSPGDPPGAETIHGLGNRKNELVLRRIREDGVDVYDGSRRYVQALREAGLPTAVVSSSANAREVLRATGLDQLFDAVVDGVVAAAQGLWGKPAPDTFLAGATALGVPPSKAAVFEDAQSGVAAGRAGGFGYVVGVDRVGQAPALREHGADVVVTDLCELLDRP